MNFKTKQTESTIMLSAKSARKKDLNSFLSSVKTFANILSCKLILKPNKKKISKFSVLKSPHVNKVAQEQFQKKTHSFNLTLKPRNCNTSFLLLLVKNLFSKNFSGITLSATITLRSGENSSLLKNYCSPNTPKSQYLFTLDAKGELLNRSFVRKYKKSPRL